MRDSQRLKDERDYVETVLGVGIICDRCKCNLASYARHCTADLSDPCPGFLAIEAVRERFYAARSDTAK